ncbi:tRNA lysidine(34) synthetase TilS [Brevundimonas bacteroides]|uniref:tRNA lysidine(34) synthetase TilS n=1 Tax=Brevundimonas bacteroides TaxID=74311 RepID=UPI000AF89C55|nr:tRNA lysidine(34) synthetase TilS [Brevundimonas bacteroides]
MVDARLERDAARPVAVALSGGGDSVALLHIAATWAKRAGRRLLAITVDHGLNPDSADWNRFCEIQARRVGADWTPRRWEGEKPASGLPAAARRARHALIADAAREAGARVVLFGHTADDADEGDWMRERGSTLGRLREWSPSPAWPEGRGLMLLRPMLGERREVLRELLRETGAEWVEDPANARFGRGAARRALTALPEGEGLRLGERSDPQAERVRGSALGGGRSNPSPFRAKSDRLTALGRSSPLPLGEGFNGIDNLASTLLCAAGHDRPPRAAHLDALAKRIAAAEPFTATLAGARIEATAERLLVLREAGEFRRRPPAPLPLAPDQPTAWDGRYEITADAPGWSVVPALGRLAALSDADRAVVSLSSAAARGALPVLIRDGDPRPVLAWRRARVLALAPRRLKLASGETTQEKDLADAVHGETPPPDLF